MALQISNHSRYLGMSSKVPNDAMFKAKYAEIAELKKSIDARQATSRTTPSPTGYIPGPSRRTMSGPIRGYKASRQAFQYQPYKKKKSIQIQTHNLTATFDVAGNQDGKSALGPKVQQGGESTTIGGGNSSQYIVVNNKLLTIGAAMTVSQTRLDQVQPRWTPSALNSWTSGDVDAVAASTRHGCAILAQIIDREKLVLKLNARFKSQVTMNVTQYANCDRIWIESIKYAVAKWGDLLVPLEYFKFETKNTPVMWDNEQYVRKSGQMLRRVQPKKRLRGERENCRYFSRTGICQKGPHCKYNHDISRIRMCHQYCLDKCHNKNCLLSHETSVFTMPYCRYFLGSGCSNTNCKFLHHKPLHYDEANYEIWTCRPFAISGYCSRGTRCLFLHQFCCPDFEEDGFCARGTACTLTHQITKRTQELMAAQSNKYLRPDVILNDKLNKISSRTIVSSYTVDPSDLFTSCQFGRYDVYIDMDSNREPSMKFKDQSVSLNSFSANCGFEISLSDSDEGTESDRSTHDGSRDALRVNDDYVCMNV